MSEQTSDYVVAGHVRGNYLCTQCLGARQPKDGPNADVLVVLHPAGNPDAEEYACLPCADAIADGASVSALKIEVHK